MNQVRPFDPLGNVHVELGSVKLNKIVLEQHAVAPAFGGIGTRVTRTGSGTITSTVKKRPPPLEQLPFQIYAAGNKITATAGTVQNFEVPRKDETNPSDGIWYFETFVSIDIYTGAITDYGGQWVKTESTDTATDFYKTMGQIEVKDKQGSNSSAINYDYGPVFAILHGGVGNVWSAEMV